MKLLDVLDISSNYIMGPKGKEKQKSHNLAHKS